MRRPDHTVRNRPAKHTLKQNFSLQVHIRNSTFHPTEPTLLILRPIQDGRSVSQEEDDVTFPQETRAHVPLRILHDAQHPHHRRGVNGSPELSLYKETLPEITGTPNASQAWAI